MIDHVAMGSGVESTVFDYYASEEKANKVCNNLVYAHVTPKDAIVIPTETFVHNYYLLESITVLWKSLQKRIDDSTPVISFGLPKRNAKRLGSVCRWEKQNKDFGMHCVSHNNLTGIYLVPT